MKKSEPSTKNFSMLKNQTEYLKNLGEKAAIYTFTKNSHSQKFISPIIHPQAKRITFRNNTRKSDTNSSPVLSPLSRDISHLRDRFQAPSTAIPIELPSDIKTIKRILETEEHLRSVVLKQSKNVPIGLKKELSLEKLQKEPIVELPSIEKLLLGPPTGRQEINNLKKWFESAKDLPEYQENEENKKSLYLMCCKELIRQVSVQCAERGELLFEIFDYFIDKSEKNSESLNVAIKHTQKVKKVVLDDFKFRELEFKEKIEVLEKEKLECQEEVLRRNKEIYGFKKELLGEREIFEEWKMKMGLDDPNSLRELRMMHKSTNITPKGRDSLFRFNLNPRPKNEVVKTEVSTQTETITYSRALKNSIKVKKNPENEVKTSEDQIEIEPNPEKSENSKPQDDAALPEVTLENPEKIPESELKIETNPNETPQIITVSDQECQTCFSLEIIYYDYIEANVFIESDSLSRYEEDLSQLYERKPSYSYPEDGLLENQQKMDENHKRKSSRIQRISIIVDSDEAKKNSNLSESANKYRTNSALEVIPDKNSSEEQIPFDESIDGVSEISEKSQKKNEKVQKKSDRNKNRGMPKIGVKNNKVALKNKLKATQSIEIKINELGSENSVNPQLESPSPALLETEIQEKQAKLSYLKAQISKKKAKLKSLSPKPHKLTPITIKSLENNSIQTAPIEKLSPDNLNSSKNSSFSSELDSPQTKPKSNTLKKSQTLSINSPKAIKTDSDVPNSQNRDSHSSENEILEESSSKSSNDLIKSIAEAKHKKLPRRLTRKFSNPHFTEFVLFQFGKKTAAKEQIKKNPAKKLVAAIITKKDVWLKKSATISRKMVNKLMSTIYLSYLSKNDTTDSLAEHLYDDFLSKYGIKKVADRKFTEFICSLFACDDSKRAKTFLRFIGAASLINSSNFSEESLNFYLNCLNFMINSKVGIMVYDETLDKIMFPLARANECIKEKLSHFDKTVLNKITQKFENNKTPDVKKINSLGMIDGETVLETMTEVFESAREHVLQGVELLICALKHGENKEILEKFEALMLIRKFCSGKTEEIEQFLSGKESISAKEFFAFCLEKCCCSIESILHVVPDERKSMEDAWNDIKPGVDYLRTVLEEIRTVKNVQNETFEVWEGKLTHLLQGVTERDPYESLIAFRVYSDELARLHASSSTYE